MGHVENVDHIYRSIPKLENILRTFTIGSLNAPSPSSSYRARACVDSLEFVRVTELKKRKNSRPTIMTTTTTFSCTNAFSNVVPPVSINHGQWSGASHKTYNTVFVCSNAVTGTRLGLTYRTRYPIGVNCTGDGHFSFSHFPLAVDLQTVLGPSRVRIRFEKVTQFLPAAESGKYIYVYL